jgi:hypothetical protein
LDRCPNVSAASLLLRIQVPLMTVWPSMVRVDRAAERGAVPRTIAPMSWNTVYRSSINLRDPRAMEVWA